MLREGGRLQSAIIVDGGAIESAATETVYGATQAQIEELVGNGPTDLHYHTSVRGRQNTYMFQFGGDIGRYISYGGDADYALDLAVPYASSVVRLTMAVETVSVGGSTVIQVYRDDVAIAGCQVTLPEGTSEICTHFAMGLYNFSYCDRLTVGAWITEAGMTLATDGQAVLVLQAV